MQGLYVVHMIAVLVHLSDGGEIDGISHLIQLTDIIHAISHGSTSTKRADLTTDQAELINSGKSKVVSVRSTLGKIRDTEIREAGYSICRTCDRIFKALIEQPKSIMSARQFLTYYLPTINLILEKYEKVERSGTDSGKMAEKVKNYLNDVDKALKKFYTNLFEDEKLDLTVEMEAMTMAVKRDGLITDDELRQELSSAASGKLQDIDLSI